ncbi:MAG: hypothetical protein AAGH68_07210 [Pseudomonadota bacterium]
MSYDLMVFDPAVAPRDRAAFMDWYGDVTKWSGGRDYQSPEGMSGNLRTFYDKLRQEFPPMNGPHAAFSKPQPQPTGLIAKIMAKLQRPGDQSALDIDDRMITDYTFADNAIYMAFAWAVERKAYNRVVNVALDSNVGFFDVSADSGDILYEPDDFYELMGL